MAETLTLEEVERWISHAEGFEAHLDEDGKFSAKNVYELIKAIKALGPVARAHFKGRQKVGELTKHLKRWGSGFNLEMQRAHERHIDEIKVRDGEHHGTVKAARKRTTIGINEVSELLIKAADALAAKEAETTRLKAHYAEQARLYAEREGRFQKRVGKQIVEIERLRKALKFYSEKRNYRPTAANLLARYEGRSIASSPVQEDMGSRARTALGKGE